MILKILMSIVSAAIIVLSLLQGGKSDGLVSALSGQNSELFSERKERGSELVLSRITACLGVSFFVIAVIIQMS